jgi:hypothetical protein
LLRKVISSGTLAAETMEVAKASSSGIARDRPPEPTASERFRFFDEEIGNVIFDAVLESACWADEFMRFGLVLEFALAFRAHQNLNQFFGKHSLSLGFFARPSESNLMTKLLWR